MRKNLIKLLLHYSIVIMLLFIYCLIVKGNIIFDWVIFSLTFVSSILLIIFRKDLITIGKEIPFDRFIAIIGLEIALIVFIQTTSQVQKNNEEYKWNSIKSDNLFNTQLRHASELNENQNKHAQTLNDSIIAELTKIQTINKNLSIATETQLRATQKQLELSEQSLVDYIYESRAQVIKGKTTIERIDTLENDLLHVKITNKIYNNGKRRANEVEIRHLIILKDSSIHRFNLSKEPFLDAGLNQTSLFLFPISKDMIKEFYYCIQIIYYDEKYPEPNNNCYYYQYFNVSNVKGLYKPLSKDITFLRSMFDKVLLNNELSLTKN